MIPAEGAAQGAAQGAAPSESGSAAEVFELEFHLRKDALRFQMFALTACIVAHLYNIACSNMFFSSLYPVLAAGNATEHARPSAADAILMTSHVLAIDTTSAMFVTTGFFSAYTFANVPASDRADICKVVSIYMLLDVWFAGFLSIVSGSIFHLVRHTFRARDVALTAIESALSLRALDFSQDPEHWHSMNPTAWPVLCLFWGIMLTPLTLAGNEHLRRCGTSFGAIMPWVNSSAPILVISLFALMHDDNNIFYMNAANLGYRVLEYNFGVCVYCSMQASPSTFWRIASVLGALWLYVMAMFVMLWWAELGAPVLEHRGACIRMYHFSPCIDMHHGFLMRGCFLGVVCLCRVLTASEDVMERLAVGLLPHERVVTASMSAVLFTWPVCYVVHLLLEMNFGLSIVRDNTALLTLVVPHVSFALALLWDSSCKPTAFAAVERLLDRALRGSEAFVV